MNKQLFQSWRLAIVTAELNALGLGPQVFDTICDQFNKVREELDQMTSVEWERETTPRAAYEHGEDVLKRAFQADIAIRGFSMTV